jgi:SPRY domain
MFSAAKTAGPSGYNINNSLRFRSSASAYLSRTPASASNRKTWTWSGWVKKAPIQGTSTAAGTFFCCTTGTTDSTYLRFGFWKDLIFVGNYDAFFLQSTPVYRDPSAWYHIVVSTDTTQGTASNRMRIYVNNVEVTAWGVDQRSTYLTSSVDLGINQATQHSIGSSLPNAGDYFDGYMAEVNFIDGQQLTPSSFGSTNATTGVWQPAAYTGTYGTNGFYLNFSSIATTSGSNTGLGKDFSGNGNYWNTNNISVTSGTTYDAMLDVPTLTSATVANYPTLNPLIRPYSSTTDLITWGNLRASSTSGPSGSQGATMSFTSGKYYFEATATTVSGANVTWIGVCNNLNYYSLGTATSAFVRDYGYTYASNGKSYTNATPSGTTYGATYTSGDIIGVAIDADAGTMTFYKNGTSQGTAFTGMSYTGGYVFGCTEDNNNVVDFNFGQRPFSYTPPSGFVALNTFNLPNSTIVQGNKYMDATLYTGNGSTQSITNTAGFKPDFVWMKSRSSGSYSHRLLDSVRGVTKELYSNETTAEYTDANSLTSFNSNGWTIGSSAGVNANTVTFVGWQWQAGQGSTSSNTNGSITSTVSVNATAGFSVVTWTNTNTANQSVGHGLGVAPKMIITKDRDNGTFNWAVWFTGFTKDEYLLLNTTGAKASYSTLWYSVPDSSKFYIGSTGTGLNYGTDKMVAYCWAEIAGFSKFTSYTGNGSADGPFVYCGFRPKFILTKNSSGTTADWDIWDTSRNTYNAADAVLAPNTSAAEATSYYADILSNGFKIRNNYATWNGSGYTYIVAAFAENPFKNANAR